MGEQRTIGLGTADITDDDIDAVAACLRSGRVSPGPLQAQFEQAVASRHGKQYGVFVNSGQSALHLSLELLKKQTSRPTLKVLCPAVTYISTLHAVWNAQCDVVLADVDPVNFMLTESLTDRRFDAVMPVDLFGKAWRPVSSGRPIIEDACEAIGALGVGYGDLVCLSFYASHSITTGSGGMVLTDDPDTADVIRRLSNHGRSVAPTGDSLDKSRQFVFTDEGWSYKSSDINAALGLSQLRRLDSIIKARQANAGYLLGALGHYAELQLSSPAGHTFQMFPIICRPAGLKPALVAHLNARGIETRDAMPIVTQPVVIERLGIKPGQFPVADHIARDGFYIGCHQDLGAQGLAQILDSFESFFVMKRHVGILPPAVELVA